MKKITLAILMMAITASTAFAETVTIYTGPKGGGYHQDSKALKKRLEQRTLGKDYEFVIKSTAGSDEATLSSCSDDLSIWYAQGDALWKRETKDGCELVEAGLYGKEVAMLLFPPKSRNSKLSHIKAGDSVFVAKVGSGSELTAKNWRAIEKEYGRSDSWSDMELKNGDARRATAMAAKGKIKAAILVAKPNSKSVTKLIEQGWYPGKASDKDINDLLSGDQPLYSSTKYTAGDKTNWGYEVPSYIGTTVAIEEDHPDLYDALLGALE